MFKNQNQRYVEFCDKQARYSSEHGLKCSTAYWERKGREARGR